MPTTPPSLKKAEWLTVGLLLPVGVILLLILIWPIVQGISLSFYNTRILN